MIKFAGMPSVNPIQRKFEELFKINKNQFNNIWDKMLTAITGNIEIDIIKFDEILHERFGDYEDEEKSMEEMVKEKYGKEAYDFFILLMFNN
jgi:hypothetical protein